MVLDELMFSEIGANIYMQMPADPKEQEFPPGFTGQYPRKQ
ncbi:hypothetical protein Ct9H90mP29_12430 [bacterium]|nr:MAG: hypothetical protein Ct9H90mP29_12430 [bacterium]